MGWSVEFFQVVTFSLQITHNLCGKNDALGSLQGGVVVVKGFKFCTLNRGEKPPSDPKRDLRLGRRGRSGPSDPHFFEIERFEQKRTAFNQFIIYPQSHPERKVVLKAECYPFPPTHLELSFTLIACFARVILLYYRIIRRCVTTQSYPAERQGSQFLWENAPQSY